MMQYKSKEKKMTVVVLLLALIAIGIAKGAGFANTRSAMRIGYTGNEGRRSWSGRYVFLDGTMKKSLHPKNDVVRIAVETQSGTISMEITDADGNTVFCENAIETGTFAVEVSGKIVVKITADGHKGSFCIE